MIDHQRFLSLRTTARMSQRGVALGARVTVPVVRAVEEGRSEHLTLRTVGRLAGALGCSVHDIVVDTREIETADLSPIDNEATGPDARQLEALLFAAGKLLHKRVVGEVLGWSHERSEAAAAHLERHNGVRGVEFYRLNVQWGLRPCSRVASIKVLARLQRQKTARDGLNREQARVLYEYFLGKGCREHGEHRGGVQIVVETLLAAGLLERDVQGTVGVGRAVRCALEPLMDLQRGKGDR